MLQCFLSIPALIYLVMVPMWTRAWRFANVYAYAGLDIAFTILWFAAFIAVAEWNSAGIRKGDNDTKDSPTENGSCGHFAYGDATKCSVSKASVGFGVIICLLFAVTSAMSIHGVMQFRRTGMMQNGNTRIHGQAEQLRADDGDKDTWNANTDELDPQHPSHDNPFDDPADERRAYGQLPQQDAEQGLGLLGTNRTGHTNTSHDEHSMMEAEYEPHPGRPLSFGSSTNLSVAPPAYEPDVVPSALSPGAYESSPGRVSFPPGNY